MYISRHLESAIHDASRDYPVVMVSGARQVGKSTMLHHMMEEGRRYVTLDDANARRLALQDPVLFFETYGAPLLIDEFQRAPSLLLEMKRRVDMAVLEGQACGGMFWLTGSQKFLMMKDVADSLAGRIALFDLDGLSAAEIEERPARIFSPEIRHLQEILRRRRAVRVHEIYERIFRGGMPQLVATGMDRERFFSNYVNTYLERDIRELAQVGKVSQFYDFLVFMAARTGQELKYADAANAIGVSAPTIKAWISLLEQSGIVYLLRPYASNVTKRLVKTPKLYFMDTGLASYLCRWPNAETLEHGAMDGAFFETYVVSEIIKSFHHAGRRADLYYYRDMDRREIDLLLWEGKKLYPVEIKKGAIPAHADKNFGVLRKFDADVQPGLILCISQELVPYSAEAWLCPVTVL
ncbi:MAG: ATP-binding protein [Schwartzia sp.]|nr:ATP-binding protein [Schwartzia sp. (in: firmicutes)]